MSNAMMAADHDKGERRTTRIDGPAGPIEVRENGEGPAVVFLPSLGRGAEDFDLLAGHVSRAGYHTICPQPRGIGGSTGDLAGLTMADLAADVAAVIDYRAEAPATLVGHAFGNRVARMTATDHPHLVDSVVLLCCGGLVPPGPEPEAALRKVFDPELSNEDHLAAVRLAFFAPGNDPSVWFNGWHGIVAAVQGAATAAQPVDHWWGAGDKDVFVVQPADDVMAVPENARRIVHELAGRASMVTIPGAGHALLPEQPEAVAAAMLTWLERKR